MTESRMLRDLVTGADREVDICVESDVAGHHVIIAVECNARGRKAHVGWIEEMKAKHDRLPTNVLVLVSRAGFYKEAARVASSYGIQILSLNSVDAAITSRLFGDSGSLWMKTFTLNPSEVVFDVPPTDMLPGESVVTSPENLVFNSSGAQEGTVKEVVEALLRTDFVLHELGSKGEASHKYFVLEWTPPEVNGKRLCLQKMEPLILRPITLIKVSGDCNFDIAEFQLKRGNLGGVNVAWGTSSVMGRPAMLVASQTSDGAEKISITTENVHLPNMKQSVNPLRRSKSVV